MHIPKINAKGSSRFPKAARNVIKLNLQVSLCTWRHTHYHCSFAFQIRDTNMLECNFWWQLLSKKIAGFLNLEQGNVCLKLSGFTWLNLNPLSVTLYCKSYSTLLYYCYAFLFLPEMKRIWTHHRRHHLQLEACEIISEIITKMHETLLHLLYIQFMFISFWLTEIFWTNSYFLFFVFEGGKSYHIPVQRLQYVPCAQEVHILMWVLLSATHIESFRLSESLNFYGKLSVLYATSLMFLKWQAT